MRDGEGEGAGTAGKGEGERGPETALYGLDPANQYAALRQKVQDVEQLLTSKDEVGRVHGPLSRSNQGRGQGREGGAGLDLASWTGVLRGA